MNKQQREILDLREETMQLKAQIKNDDKYLERLTRAEDIDEDWRLRIQARRNHNRVDWPEILANVEVNCANWNNHTGAEDVTR